MSGGREPDVAAEARAADVVHSEVIDGARFDRQPATELLRRGIDSAAALLREVLRESAVVEVSTPLTVSDRTRLVPDISIFRGREELPVAVMEMRTESTDRFALGPKRLVYARAGVAEFYFMDPQAEILRIMRTGPEELDYSWPAVSLGRGQTFEFAAFPGVSIHVADLLPVELSRNVGTELHA